MSLKLETKQDSSNSSILIWLFSVSAVQQSGDIISDIIANPVNIVKPTVNVPTVVSVPTSSWTPSQWATWPFITITGVSGMTILYHLKLKYFNHSYF